VRWAGIAHSHGRCQLGRASVGLGGAFRPPVLPWGVRWGFTPFPVVALASYLSLSAVIILPHNALDDMMVGPSISPH
jgi:hypothetical protein